MRLAALTVNVKFTLLADNPKEACTIHELPLVSNRFYLFVRLFLVGVLFLTPGWPGEARAEEGLFGSDETLNDDISPFIKWTGLLAKEPVHRAQMRSDCIKLGAGCLYNQWQALITFAKTLPRLKQVELINREMNRSTYIIDAENWGLEDYWESVYEFLTRDGDCEDYAIAKYMTLKEIGVPVDTMRIVILQDYNLNLMHAVLAVKIDGVSYILDNQLQQVVADSVIYHYAPIYSINERHWWRHLPR